MSDRYEPIRRVMEEVDDRVSSKKWLCTAIVDEIRVEDRTARLTLLPNVGRQTNWLRIYWHNAGSNYMSGCMPEVGSEVLVAFLDADPNSAIILGGGFLQGTEDVAPTPSSDNGWIIMDKYGNKITTGSDGVTIHADNVNLSNGTLQKLLNETYHDAILGHRHIDPLSGFTGAVDPSSLIKLPGHTTQQTKAG